MEFTDLPVVRCSSCGFMFSQRLMSAADMAIYYRSDFGSERHRQGQYINARINAWAIEKLLTNAHVTSFLDVGTGYGYLLKQIQERMRIPVTGVELSEQEATYGRESLGVDIKNALLSDAGLEKNSFDLVSCFEVIEHIPDPSIFLREMIEYVRPGGYVLVMTDNFASQVVQKLGAGFPKWIPHAHVSHFDPNSLRRAVLDTGAEIVAQWSYTPWELLVRLYHAQLLGKRFSAADSFSLVDTMKSEMGGSYRFFRLRRRMNLHWARLTGRQDLDGALMYLIARKPNC